MILGCAFLGLAVAAACYHKGEPMVAPKQEWYHSGNFAGKTRMTYRSGDGVDYGIMLLICYGIVACVFPAPHMLTHTVAWLCGLMMILFWIRHGVHLTIPLLLRCPLETGACILYKIENMRPAWFASLGVLLLEQAVISKTPTWPHFTEEYKHASLHVLCGGFLVGSIVRCVSFLNHVGKRAHVFAFLRQTHWKKTLRPGVFHEVVDLTHALCTGVLCHVLAMIPFYIVAREGSNSFILLPLRLVADLGIMFWFTRRDFNRWIYRDHWICHHSDFAFVYLHGPHHDALPVSFMAAHDTGALEGFLRFSLGMPDCFWCPPFAAVYFTASVVMDQVLHQHVPGVWPFSQRVVQYKHHHVEHHLLNLHPLGSGFENPPDGNAGITILIDKWLDQYVPDNKVWTWFVGEVARLEGVT